MPIEAPLERAVTMQCMTYLHEPPLKELLLCSAAEAEPVPALQRM